LRNLAAIFGFPVGVSDHSLDPCLIPALGTVMGASVIEKHFCISRNDPGLDDPIALPAKPFAEMVQSVRRAEKECPEKTLDAIRNEYGRNLVEKILGDGVKRLAPSELKNYERTNRSVHALRDIAEGETICENMIASLRTEKILRPGLDPSWETKIIGRKARAFIPAGEGIRLEDI
jgi:sialic acid synthase SpsE